MKCFQFVPRRSGGVKQGVQPVLELKCPRVGRGGRMLSPVRVAGIAKRICSPMRGSRALASMATVCKHNTVPRARTRQREAPAHSVVGLRVLTQAVRTPLQTRSLPLSMVDPDGKQPVGRPVDPHPLVEKPVEAPQCGFADPIKRSARMRGHVLEYDFRRSGI